MIPNITRADETAGGQHALVHDLVVNLAVGAALGGVVAVLFGRDAVFVLNALSFLLSALPASPHALRRAARRETRRPCGRATWRTSRRSWKACVTCAATARLLATLLVKAGLGFMGANWVILPVLGERVFPVSMAGLDPRRAGMLGMSLLMGARGVGALLGPLVGGYWAGQRPARLRMGILYGFLAVAAGYLALGVSPMLSWAVAAVVLAHAGRLPHLGLLDDPAAIANRRPVSRTGLLGRLRLPRDHHVRGHLPGGHSDRRGTLRAEAFSRRGPERFSSRCPLVAGLAFVARARLRHSDIIVTSAQHEPH